MDHLCNNNAVTLIDQTPTTRSSEGTYLSSDSYFVIMFISNGTLIFVGVIECDTDGGLSHACLAILIHQLV